MKILEIGAYLLSVLGMATLTFYLSKLFKEEFGLTQRTSMHSSVFIYLAAFIFTYTIVYDNKDFLFMISTVTGIILGAVIWMRRKIS
jgi:hypothetical protein